MGPIQTLDDFKDMLRRHARLIFQVTAAGCLFSLLHALSQPHIYAATEVIQITRPEFSDDTAQHGAAGSSARRLQRIEQRLTTRNSLLEIIDGFGLYAEHPDLKPGEMVTRLRRSLRVQAIAAPGQGAGDVGVISALSITAQMPTARQAQLVAHEFARRMIDQNTSDRIDRARETLAFFTAQETRLTGELARLDEQTAAYRANHGLPLPGAADLRRDEIAMINRALLDLDRESIGVRRAADRAQHAERAATAKRRLVELDEQLATLDAQRQLLQRRKGALEMAMDTTPEVSRELRESGRRLAQLQADLAAVSARRRQAETGLRLETGGQAERLSVIDRATLPEHPVSGGHARLVLLGGLLSLSLGLVLAFLQDLRNPIIRTARQMQRDIGITPVVSIPFLDATPPRMSRWKRLRSWAARTTA